LIFDLDGTLVDSKKDLTASVNHVRSTFGLPALPEDQIASFIGDGAQMLIQRALTAGDRPVADADVQSGVQLFLSYYREHMLDDSVLYPEVHETLMRLSDCRLAVLTNKPIRFSRTMLEGLGILHHFAAVYGGNSFERKKPDPIGIFADPERYRGSDREDVDDRRLGCRRSHRAKRRRQDLWSFVGLRHCDVSSDTARLPDPPLR
jgi:phosphoglycolate phosphatase